MFNGYWRNRAKRAEAEVARLTAHFNAVQVKLEEAQDHLDGIQARLGDRAALVSIVREGRVNRFLFTRNGEPYLIETYSAMEDDFNGWRRALIDPLPGSPS